MTQYCSCYLLFSRHWNQDTWEKNSQFWQLPNHWHFWEMALLKGEGHSIYILKSPSLEDLSQRSTNLIVLQTPCIGPCRAIPLEQLTKIARTSTYNIIKLKVAGYWYCLCPRKLNLMLGKNIAVVVIFVVMLWCLVFLLLMIQKPSLKIWSKFCQ